MLTAVSPSTATNSADNAPFVPLFFRGKAIVSGGFCVKQCSQFARYYTISISIYINKNRCTCALTVTLVSYL
jgi:hypothetical protein